MAHPSRDREEAENREDQTMCDWRDKFARWRGRLGCSQSEMARVLGCGWRYVSHLEMGFRSPSQTMQNLVRVLQENPRIVKQLLKELE